MKNVVFKYAGVIVIAGIIIILILAKIKIVNMEERKDSIFDNKKEFWNIYIDKLSTEELNTDGVPYEGFQKNGQDYVNYWVQACNVISQCFSYKYIEKDEEGLNQAKEILLNMKNTFDKYGKFPRPEYKSQNLEYGWVSSMDAPTIMVAAQMLYELTEDKVYADFVKSLEEYVVLTTDEGGYNFADENGDLWPLEYAWQNANKDTNFYVLNGSLVGYIGVKAISQVTNNERLRIYCKEVEKTYENRCEQFHYANDEWTYYMLNPKTVIPIHYMIFEKKLFESMYYLSGIQCFQDEVNFREQLLKKVLKVEFYEEENMIKYFISRACSPNFYQIDTYGTRIEFYDSNGLLLEENECLITGETQREEFYEGAFITGELVHDNAEYYKLYAVYNANSYLLFQESISMENKKDNFREIEIESIKTVYDANLESDGRNVSIQKELSEKVEGDIVFELQTVSCWNDIFALEINNLSYEEISIGLKLYDSKGNGVIRYYTPLTEGKNLVVFDARGFVGADALQDIKSIWLRIYNNNSSQNRLNIEIGNLWSMSNVRALYNCITLSEYKINPQ